MAKNILTPMPTCEPTFNKCCFFCSSRALWILPTIQVQCMSPDLILIKYRSAPKFHFIIELLMLINHLALITMNVARPVFFSILISSKHLNHMLHSLFVRRRQPSIADNNYSFIWQKSILVCGVLSNKEKFYSFCNTIRIMNKE